MEAEPAGPVGAVSQRGPYLSLDLKAKQGGNEGKGVLSRMKAMHDRQKIWRILAYVGSNRSHEGA